MKEGLCFSLSHLAKIHRNILNIFVTPRYCQSSMFKFNKIWDVALEEARYAAAVRVRDATAKENASHGTTFSFYMFPSLHDVPQVGSPSVHLLTEAAQSTNRPLDGGISGELGVPPLGVDEEQINFGSG